jgi:hypothetical protein
MKKSKTASCERVEEEIPIDTPVKVDPDYEYKLITACCVKIMEHLTLC